MVNQTINEPAEYMEWEAIMKKVITIFIIFGCVILVGCGKKSSSKDEREASATPEIQVVGDDESAASESQNSAASNNTLANKELEKIIQETLEEDARAEEAASNPVKEVKESEPEANSEDDSMTMSQKNAVRSAEDYLRLTSFSRKGLIDQLSSEYGDKFPREDAEFAVSYLEQRGMVDWKEQAVQSAKDYLNLTSFSREGLIDQLSSEYGDQYTREEAEYAADQVGY